MKIPSVECVVRVRHPEVPRDFFVSFVVDRWLGIVTGAKGFFEHEKKPKRGKHLLLTPTVRAWLDELQPEPEKLLL